MQRNAQGTIEYLIIMAVIVVVGLVVVSLLVNQTGSSGNISSSVSKISSSSGMISISEAVVDGEGNGLISLSNNSGDLLIITKLSVEGIDFNYPSTNLFQGEKKIFSLNELGSGCSCVGLEGETKTCEVIVYTTSEHGLEKQFTTSVSVDCVSDVVAKDPAVVIVPVEPIVESEDVAPLVLLLSPDDNNFWNSSSTVIFDFNVWDESIVNECSLLVNGVDVNFVVPVLGLNSISFRLDDLNFVWDINCVDEWDNVGHASSVFSLSVDANAYQINNCIQLQDMNNDLNGNYFLMNDVNCYNDTQVASGALYNGGAGFLPVGNDTNKFTGSFDGNYHTVNEL